MKEFITMIENIPANQVVWTLTILAAIIVLLFKIVPPIFKWFNVLRTQANKYENLIESIQKNTEEIETINEKINRDYERLNRLQRMVNKQSKFAQNSLEEREIILRSLLRIVQGLQEIGANGPTKEAETEISAYLLKKAHEHDNDDEDDSIDE